MLLLYDTSNHSVILVVKGGKVARIRNLSFRFTRHSDCYFSSLRLFLLRNALLERKVYDLLYIEDEMNVYSISFIHFLSLGKYLRNGTNISRYALRLRRFFFNHITNSPFLRKLQLNIQNMFLESGTN